MSVPVQSSSPALEHQDLLVGFVRLHILHHAVRGEVYGQWIIGELARHGYRLSAGTLYPMLHGMEQRGYLSSQDRRAGRSTRRVYQATARGEDALAEAKQKLAELFGELLSPVTDGSRGGEGGSDD